MGQLEWLAPLEGVPGFEDLRARYLARSASTEKPRPGPFRILDDARLGGKAGKRCAISRRLVAPGEPIKRFRLFFDTADDPSIAAEDAFETSALAAWRDRHLSDGYAPEDLPFWLEMPWVAHYIREPILRDARRHAALHAKRQTPRRSAVRVRQPRFAPTAQLRSVTVPGARRAAGGRRRFRREAAQ